MADLPRKLLKNSSLDLDDSLAKYCKRFCDSLENFDHGCPLSCFPLPPCISVCIHNIEEFPPPTSDHPAGKPFGASIVLSVSLALLATVFVVFCFYSAYRFYRRRQGAVPVQPHPGPDPGPGEEEEMGPWVDHPIWYIRTVGLEAAAIRAITVCKYKKGEGLVEGTDCSVCLTEFEDGETIRLLPKCNHAFHIPCIDTWLSSHTNCPNCRAGIVRSGSASLQNSGLNPVLLEESIPENSAIGESERVPEDEMGSGSSAEISREELILGNGNGIGMQPLRRSASVDSVAASMINANALSAESGKNKGKVSGETAPTSSSSSMEGSSVKRSLSCSAKVFLSRYSRSRASSLPQ